VPYLIIPLEHFPNAWTALAFTILFVAILPIELRIFSRSRLRGGERRDRASLLYVLTAVALSIAAIITLPYLGIGRIPVAVSYFGFVMLLSGFFLRQWSIRTLGKFFMPVVSLLEDHTLITTGPYRVIRHPAYTGLLLELVGASLAVANIVACIIAFVFLIPTLLYRILIEEEVLIEKFGDTYRAYQRRAKKLIPGVF
jgi:protein-S-isoprenylcysteine O-methyltransferase Ste14